MPARRAPRLRRLPIAQFVPPKWRAAITIVVAVAVFAFAWWQQSRQPQPSTPAQTPATTQPQSPPPIQAPATAPPADAASLTIPDQTIRNEDGRVLYRGDIDLAATLARIAAGARDEHVNDGAYYRNFERRLPAQHDRDYYREFVVRTPGHRGVGPQRLVLGNRGEAYYTPDHYQTFRKLPVTIAESERP
ncbi:MAG: ribonuclease [Myxococcales bacterium]|nr:ribonuclease [Myxococcales bacterium]